MKDGVRGMATRLEEDLFRQSRLNSRDLHLNRITNAADARAPRDYVTLQQLEGAIAAIDPRAITGPAGIRNTSIGFKRAYNFAYTGNLFITSSLCPVITTSINAICNSIVATVEIAPTGANITIRVLQTNVLWTTLTLLANNTSVTGTPPVGTLLTGKRIVIELTAVGTTFPGANFMLNIDTTVV